MLHGAAAADDDDDDDDGNGGGKPSKRAKKKAAQALSDAQQAYRDAKKLKANGGGGGNGGGTAGGSGRGGGGSGGGVGTPGDSAGRVTVTGDLVSIHWPKISGPNGRNEATRKFGVGGVKKELTAAGVKEVSPSKLCVPFQFMYALSTTFSDDNRRLAYAHRFCSNPRHQHHNSVTASAHEQLSGLDRAMLLRHEKS